MVLQRRFELRLLPHFVRKSERDLNVIVDRIAVKPTTIWDYLSGMKEALGGYISVRYADGSVYVDYTVQSGVVSEQHIIKGLNLVSIRTTIESEEYCTRVYPIGSDIFL